MLMNSRIVDVLPSWLKIFIFIDGNTSWMTLFQTMIGEKRNLIRHP